MLDIFKKHYFPYVAALVAVVAGGLLAAKNTLAFPKSLAVGTMTLGFVVAGLTATQRNMLLGMGGTDVLKFAAKTGYYKDILNYLKRCLYAGLIIVFVSLLRLFLSESNSFLALWLGIWTGSIVLVLALIAQNECLMFRIVKRFMEEQKDKTAN